MFLSSWNFKFKSLFWSLNLLKSKFSKYWNVIYNHKLQQCNDSLSFSESCFHTGILVYKMFYASRTFFSPDLQHTEDPDIDRQRCSKYLHFLIVLKSCLWAPTADFPSLFIITLSTDAQVYLLSINEPQFADELEERRAHLKLEFWVFEDPCWATPTVHVRILLA